MTLATVEEVRALLRPPQTPTIDRSTETLARYQRALPDHEFAALNAWSTTFYPYQRAWVFEPARRAIHLGSRQIGKSHESSATGVLWGAFNGELTTIVSIGQLESAEVLDKATRHATVLQRLGSRMAEFERQPSKTEIRFKSGGRVLALPSTGGRSFTGNLFLDELAYQEHADEVWDSAMPTTIRGGLKSRIASTANGVGNLFHSLWTDPAQRQGYATHETTLLTAIEAGLKVDLLDCWTAVAKADKRLFDQIFNCRFIDGTEQYIESTFVYGASQQNLYIPPNSGEWYAGLDIGRTNDLTSLVVVHFDGALARVRAIRTVKRTDSPALHGLVEYAFSEYPLRRLCVDATGIGAFPAEEMQRRYGRHRVEPVTFGEASKEELATTLFSAFTDEWLHIPATDSAIHDIEHDGANDLRKDICAIKRIILPGGGIRYDAARTAAGHADRAWALALALYGITNRPTGKTVHFAGKSVANA